MQTMAASTQAAAVTERLSPCPDSPNCVSSQADDEQHAIDPIVFSGDPSRAWSQLKATLQLQKRTTVIEEGNFYLHAEVRSLVFRFVDDIEFILVPEQSLIHVRSASRTGYSDFGVNRRRVEAIRQSFEKLQAAE